MFKARSFLWSWTRHEEISFLNRSSVIFSSSFDHLKYEAEIIQHPWSRVFNDVMIKEKEENEMG